MELNVLLKSGEVIPVAAEIIASPMCHFLRQNVNANNTFISFNYDDDITTYILGAAEGNAPAIESRRWARLIRHAWEDTDNTLFNYMIANVPENIELYLLLRVATQCNCNELCDKVLRKLFDDYEWQPMVDIFIEYGARADEEHIDWIFDRWNKLGYSNFDAFDIKYRLCCAYGYDMTKTLQNTDFSSFSQDELFDCSTMSELGVQQTHMFECMHKIMVKK